MEWFFGRSGFLKLRELNDAFKAKTLDHVNSVLKTKYANYSPWMSNLENLSSLQAFFEVDKLILIDHKEIETLEQLYLLDENEKTLALGNVSNQELQTFENAISLVQNANNDISELFNDVIKHIVPLNTNGSNFQSIGIGFSEHLAKGCIFLSVPKMKVAKELQLATNIAHELGHQCLYIYQTADPIIKSGIHDPVFSYVRKANRPAIQAFHATVALAFMVRFLTQLTPSAEDGEYYEQCLKALKNDFVESLNAYMNVTFSELGRFLYEDLRTYAETT